ncbi:MAG: hypothetical protein ABSG86_00860 [Thermoguttaceae bacterium]|jgi:hypothetical protein
MSEETLPAKSRGKMVVFGAKQIRRVWVNGQWFFSVVDIIAVLTDSDSRNCSQAAGDWLIFRPATCLAAHGSTAEKCACPLTAECRA